jgi:hypothetical protein
VWHTPVGGKGLIVRHMEARGYSYGISDYATAYPVAFLSHERIVMSSANRVRIKLYETEVGTHRQEAVVVSHRPCDGGSEVLPGFYFCPADQPR